MSSLGEICYRGELAEVREAIGRGEDVNEKRFADKTGLMWAVTKKHNSIVKLLLEQPTLDLNCTDSTNGQTALHRAVCNDNVEGVKMLLADPRLNSHNHKDGNGWTPSMAAIVYEKVNPLRELVAHPSVDLDTMDMEGRSLEDWARWVFNQPLM